MVQKTNKKTLLAAILKSFLEVFKISVYKLVKFRLFYISGEEIVEKDARMSLLRLFEHIYWNITLSTDMGFGREVYIFGMEKGQGSHLLYWNVT